jgi:1,2-diacylglycerol 3-alpha-glucosyltransferase
MKVALLFSSYGPYHLARLSGSQACCEIAGIAGGSGCVEYQWEHESPDAAGIKVVNPEGAATSLSAKEFRVRLRKLLEETVVDAVAVPGWYEPLALASILWAAERGCPVVMMSDTSSLDSPSRGLKGWLRRRVIGLCSAALVAGGPHRDFICAQGMSQESVFVGYDVVDNSFYETESARWRVEDRSVGPYFLASNRFIEKKNLFRLIEAQALYAGKAQVSGETSWPLVLLGDGYLKEKLIAHALGRGFTVVSGAPWEAEMVIPDGRILYLPGFRQINELPRFYAHAGAFVHASTKEQWGLVVNEAMACRLVVLVSDRCGCASDLVIEGESGFTFNPLDVNQLSKIMRRVARMPPERRSEMGMAGQRLVGAWGPKQFGLGLKAAAEKAISVGPRSAGILDRFLLQLLVNR